MHFGDSIFIFLLALVLFGPKKLPEIGRQLGKLLAEFRRASNDFKIQIDEELRAMEQQERQKQLEQAAAATPVVAPVNELPTSTETSAETTTEPSTDTNTDTSTASPEPLTVKPPSTGETVSSTAWPYGGMPRTEDVDSAYQRAVDQEENTHHAVSNGSGPVTSPETPSESEQAPIQHG